MVFDTAAERYELKVLIKKLTWKKNFVYCKDTKKNSSLFNEEFQEWCNASAIVLVLGDACSLAWTLLLYTQ